MTQTDQKRPTHPTASSYFRWRHCPGCQKAAQECGGSDTGNQASDEGTTIHSAISQLYAGEEMDTDALSEEQKDTMQRMTSMADSVIEELMPDAGHVFQEERIYVRDKSGEIIASGQPDLVLLDSNTDPHKALIIDFKAGRLEVSPAFQNDQIRLLAVALQCEYPTLENVYGAIAQPWVSGTPSVTLYDRMALAVAKSQVIADAKAAEKGQYRAAGSWCEYCPAMGSKACPESTAYALVIDSNLPDNPSARANVLQKALHLEKLVPALKERAIEILAENPDAIEGWTLAPDKPNKTQVEQLIRLKTGLKGQAVKDAVEEAIKPFASAKEISFTRSTIKDANGLLGALAEQFGADEIELKRIGSKLAQRKAKQ